MGMQVYVYRKKSGKLVATGELKSRIKGKPEWDSTYNVWLSGDILTVKTNGGITPFKTHKFNIVPVGGGEIPDLHHELENIFRKPKLITNHKPKRIVIRDKPKSAREEITNAIESIRGY